MRSRTGLHRLLSVWVAVLQLALPPALVIADGLLERASATTAAVHVEEHSSPHCPRVHLDDCALCRTLSHLTAPTSSPPAVALIAAAEARPSVASRLLAPARASVAVHLSRAPPAPAPSRA